jgi:hypothetical protein
MTEPTTGRTDPAPVGAPVTEHHGAPVDTSLDGHTGEPRERGASHVLGLVATVGIAAALYVPLVGHRWDYLGHCTAGAGLALLAMALVHGTGRDRAASASVAALAVVALGLVGEWLWFSHLFFDFADIGAGGLGGALVGAYAIRHADDTLPVRWLTVLSAVLLIAGVLLRFGFDDAGPIG